MKITIVLGPFQPLPPEGLGAVEKVWHELARAFARRGHEVVLIGKSAAPAPAAGIDGVRLIALRGYAASGWLWRDLVLDFRYALEVRSRIEASDVVVTNSFWTPVVLSLSAAARNGRLVVHVARFPKRQMWLYRRANVLQAISTAVAKEIVRQVPVLQEKVRVLPYPVDLATYRPPPAARRYDKELTILYVGRLHPEKGLLMLAGAFRRVSASLPQTRLRLVGPAAREQGGGGQAFLDAMRQAVNGLPVEFAGAIATPLELARELQQAHCFCYPSQAEKGEAFGLAVLEAMATGLPVVVSDLACFGDFLDAGRQGLVFDHRAPDAEARLADSLIRVLRQPELAARLGASAAARAQEFGLDEVAGRYLRLFAC